MRVFPAALAVLWLLPSPGAAAEAAPEAEPTFQQVLEDPDNPELNLRFARAQAARGNLRNAVSSLERVLAVRPDHHEARLFYALALFRLGNADAADREFATLSRLPLPSGVRAEIDGYRRQIADSHKRSGLSGRLALGFAYDTNRNFSPSSGESLFADTPVRLSGDAAPRDDLGLALSAHVEGRRDLGFQAGHEAFASFGYQRWDQRTVATSDLQALTLRGGAAAKTRHGTLTPTLLFDHVEAARSSFLQNRGLSLRLDRRIDSLTNTFSEFRGVFQDYRRTPQAPAGPDRTGTALDFTVGGERRLRPTMKLDASYTYTRKRASRDFYRFYRHSFAAGLSWLLGRGTFLRTSLAAYFDDYPHPDVALSRRLRSDTTWRASLSFGAPLGLLSPSLKDLLWTAGYDYDQGVSSLPNYSYTNNRLTTTFTYRWTAGF